MMLQVAPPTPVDALLESKTPITSTQNNNNNNKANQIDGAGRMALSR